VGDGVDRLDEGSIPCGLVQVLASRELTRLAGFTERVTHLMHALDEVSTVKGGMINMMMILQ
jgi:hypothetical protein